ncbi:hypothetical protein V5N11_011384 [Cardamine amara subsp. amara]|uniref:Uncharacterized protein n=1 Tax=Cardamine amara subsp. amara TaxID=228776 RepID=A0ABD1A7B5_CARAN
MNSGKQANVSLLSRCEAPKLMNESAGEKSCCIFRVRHRLGRTNRKAYEPTIVSIGPFHHGRKQVKMIEEHKPRFLQLFVYEAGKHGVCLEDLGDSVSKLEEEIRSSYSENLAHLDSEELRDMMLLDGCFILMTFLIIARKVQHDTIFMMPWILPAIRSDLLLLENQVPLFLLQILLTKSKISSTVGLQKLAFNFFSYSNSLQITDSSNDIEATHLLDLIRQTFIPSASQTTTPSHTSLSIAFCSGHESETETSWLDSGSSSFLRLILSAKKLCSKGIRFKPRKDAYTLLDIRFEIQGVLHIPPIVMDDFIRLAFLNFVAFEQFYSYCSNYITSYVAFMGCLMNEEGDATFLSSIGIVENYFESAQEVSSFFKSTSKDVAFDISRSYLADVFERVNKHTSNRYTFGFFRSSITSRFALSTLIALVFIQTIFQVFVAFRVAYGYWV